ncbi:2-keto-4-pentenoate hydratase [Lacicoccus alkaliphilus]|uniref:2-oxo-hept-3-ene-1,7-dioate hydratase n=1 Tax=Lacicoccus alkaliphilus DSM 16010 TaxID=1123231 RepID=A0A1M7IKL4_9BACL|nr:hydratase [Salinicoccus alkaliphilus]SHM41158.1 2-oxo-hept-3-ene-1,7-dioate hydratase [Salinicoccus alkaliphilus DSM 16010]
MSAADELYEAYVEKVPLALGSIGVASLEEAYQIQEQVLKMKINDNDEILRGYKVSLTSEETQDIFNHDEPLYGALTNKNLINNAKYSDYNEPKLEMEIAFLVQENLSIDDSEEDIIRKCLIAPGLEIPDGRYKDWFPNASKYEIVADSAVAGGVTFGQSDFSTYEKLDDIKGVLTLDGEVIKEGRSSEVMGHPAKAVKWLIGKLHAHGKIVEAGKVISSGTFNLPVELEKGYYEAVYENIGKVSLEVK